MKSLLSGWYVGVPKVVSVEQVVSIDLFGDFLNITILNHIGPKSRSLNMTCLSYIQSSTI